MLEIQKFLKKNPDLQMANHLLRKQFNLKVRKHLLKTSQGKDYVYQYNYTEKSLPENNPIVRESRGLLLDSKADIVSCSLPKFFHHNDPNNNTQIDWNDAYAEDMYNGELVVLYNHQDTWFVQTLTSPEASEVITSDNKGITTITSARACVISGIRMVTGESDFSMLDKGFSYVFELLSPKINPAFSFTNVVLLTIFNKDTGVEITYKQFKLFSTLYNFEVPRRRKVNSIHEVYQMMNSCYFPIEGYVVRDVYNNRIKCKKPSTLDVVRLDEVGHIELVPIAKAVLDGKADDIVACHPKYAHFISIFLDTIDFYIGNLDVVYGDIRDLKMSEFEDRFKNHPLFKVLSLRKSHTINHFENLRKHITPLKLIELVQNKHTRRFENEYDSLQRLLRARLTPKQKEQYYAGED